MLCNSNETRDLGIIIDNNLNFYSHISAISHKANVRASLILRSFTTKDPVVLTKAFVIYVRPILEYCTPVWSPHTVCNINKLERCQRWFTKRVQGLYNTNYFDRLAQLGLESLQSRRLKYDLVIVIRLFITISLSMAQPILYSMSMV